MTDTQWHASSAVLAEFAFDPAAIDDMTAASIEAHLVTCPECRRQMTMTADPALVTVSWDALADRIDQPRARIFERVLQRIGISADLSRLVAATPALQGAALLSICALAVAAAAVSRTTGAEGLFLVLAPLLPLVAVAASFAPAGDPAGEVGIATPVNGAGLVVRRATAVAGITLVILAAAALALPDLGWRAAAWVLPALALSLASMALRTWLRLEVAVAVLAGAWLATVWSLWWLAGLDTPVIDSAAFAASGQLTAFAAAVASGVVAAARRDRFATMEAFR